MPRIIALAHHDRKELLAALWEVWEAGHVAALFNQEDPGFSAWLERFSISEVWSEQGRELLKRSGELPFPGTLILTSGSSGEPKAVYHTIEAHCASARGVARRLEFREGDGWLLNLPLWHVSGLAIALRAREVGAELRFEEPATHFSMVDTQLRRLVNSGNAFDGKAILLGGGPIPDSLFQEALDRGWPCYRSYGMTELASTIAIEGKLLQGREAEEREGEIWLRGETLFSGYWDGQELHKPFDQDGWFNSGDCGQLNRDRLEIIGRKGRMFISGGENIHPEEIERAFLRLPGVMAAKVVSESHLEFGRVAVAKVHPWRPSLLEELSEFLPRYKLPKRIDPMVSLPKTKGERLAAQP